MPSASSVIRVSIIGDAKKLSGAIKDADRSTKGLLSSSAKVGLATLGGLGAVAAGTEFIQDAIGEADRLGDATARLNRIIGETDTAKIAAVAEDFTKLGLSKQDVLELSANFASIGIAAQLSAPEIAALSDDVAATAAAMSLVDDEGRDAAAFVDLIGKAAGGAEKPLKELGISLTDAEVAARAMAMTGQTNAKALTDSELASARLALILEKLRPALDDATTGTADLEQKQREMQAQIETLSGKIGQQLEPALLAMLNGISEIIDELGDWPGAIGQAGDAVVGFGRTVLGPLGNVRDALEGILGLFGQVSNAAFAGSNQSFINERDLTRTQSNQRERNGGGP
jgi:hypothetical protein